MLHNPEKQFDLQHYECPQFFQIPDFKLSKAKGRRWCGQHLSSQYIHWVKLWYQAEDKV